MAVKSQYDDYKVITPPEIDADVLAATKSFNDQAPFYINITPTPFAGTGRCHFNVTQQIEKAGGTAFFCWAIWQCKAWVEAEFHCLWKKPDGTLVDITPDPDGETRRLIQAELIRRFEGRAIPKKWFLLSDEDKVAEAIAMFAKADRIRCAYAPDIPLSQEDARRVTRLRIQASVRLAQ